MNSQTNAARGLGAKALGQSGANSIPFVYNFDPTKLPKWRAAVAATRLGSREAVINCIGDSRTAGSNGNNNSYTGARPFAWPVQLPALLAAKGLPAHADNFYGDQNTPSAGVAYPTYDTRVSEGSGWGKNGSFWAIGPGSTITNTTNTTGVLAFTPANSFDTIDVYYVTGGGFGSFTTNVDGGASLGTTATAGTSGVGKATFSVTAGTHTINIQNATVGNGVFIYGIETRLSTARKVSVRCLGAGGASSVWWNANTNPWQGVQPIATLGGDLTIIDIAVNDSILGTSLPTFQTNMTAILNAVKAVTDVIVVGGVAGSTASNPLNGDPSLASYQAILFSLAQSMGLPYVDWKARWRDFTTSNALGFFGTTSDPLHPGPTGYLDLGGMMASLLTSPGLV